MKAEFFGGPWCGDVKALEAEYFVQTAEWICVPVGMIGAANMGLPDPMVQHPNGAYRRAIPEGAMWPWSDTVRYDWVPSE